MGRGSPSLRRAEGDARGPTPSSLRTWRGGNPRGTRHATDGLMRCPGRGPGVGPAGRRRRPAGAPRGTPGTAGCLSRSSEARGPPQARVLRAPAGAPRRAAPDAGPASPGDTGARAFRPAQDGEPKVADADETVGEDLEEKSLENTPHRQGHRLDAVSAAKPFHRPAVSPVERKRPYPSIPHAISR